VILNGYGAKTNSKYGPRATVTKDRIAVTGVVAARDGKGQCFGLAVLDDTGTITGQLAPQAFLGSRGVDLPWGVAFDPDGRLLVAGSSLGAGGKKRFAVARFVVK
jgi:hypothetical protein